MEDFEIRTETIIFGVAVQDKINFWQEKADTYNRGDNGLSPDVTAGISSRRRLKQMKYMKEFSNQYNLSTA